MSVVSESRQVCDFPKCGEAVEYEIDLGNALLLLCRSHGEETVQALRPPREEPTR